MKRLVLFIVLFGSLSCLGQPLKKLLRKQASSDPYGSELITNGTFAAGTDWTLTDGASISSGEMVVNSGNAFTTFATQAISIVNGHTYKIEFDVSSYTSGVFHYGLGSVFDGNYSGDVNANGHVSLNITLTSGTAPATIVFFSWTPVPVLHLDNVSVKEVL